jgi:Holliday junction resolvasome RuvABC endonuclease subunit
MIALGVDPGFASFGAAVVVVEPGYGYVANVSVLRTEKSARKLCVNSVEDNARRVFELGRSLVDLLAWADAKHGGVDVVCAESMSFPRQASVAGKMCLAWGMLLRIVQERDIPLVQASPQAIKKALTGNKAASKEDIAEAVGKRFDGVASEFNRLPKGQHEHGYDAIAAVLACEESEVVKAVRGRR